MSSVASFFRLFDLAFFAPGGLILLAVHGGGVYALPMWLENPDLSKLRGVIALVSLLAVAYVIGLLIHGIREFLLGSKCVDKSIRKLIPSALEGSGRPWYQGLLPESRGELAHYFWYMRATCANLAVAMFVLFVFGTAIVSAWWLLAAVPAILLLWLSYRFDGALDRVMKSSCIEVPPGALRAIEGA